jgi:diketogulonate reductase-like aldo/keto reductase
MNRRELLLAAAALGVPRMGTMMKRKIPSTGEELPVIGMGTWRTFDTDPSAQLVEVLRTFFDAGGRVIDSSPMYGRSEATLGETLRKLAAPKPFLATKVWTTGREAGIAEMEDSIRKMGGCDLMQVHNLLDFRTHLPSLREMKARGAIRYWGITHYQLSAFDEMERIVRDEKPDFVQLPYSAGVREAEKRLLPACQEHGAAVLVMRPFEAGSLLRKERAVPSWAQSELDCTSWPQLLLKFILGHPAVTCPIPATGNPKHMADNVRAGFGRLPDAAMRERIVKELS